MIKMTKSIITLFLVLGVQLLLAQERTITGTVKDENGFPMPNVNIVVKDTNDGTRTNIDGNYTLDTDTNRVLIFSFIGYKNAEKTVEESDIININLTPNAEAIKEVVVVGYGTKARRATTGSITTIKNKDIVSNPVANFAESLQGKSTGLQSISASGQPGSKSTVRIRGTASVNGNLDPLYIVDGIPINNTATNFADFGALSSKSRDPLSSINAADIESVTVLKDASSTSIYGSRAANGIIMITTKKGKSGKAKFNFSSQLGVSSRATRNLEVLNTTEFLELMRESLTNANFDKATVLSLQPNTVVNTNWAEYAYRDWSAVTTRNDFSVSGGTSNGRYYMSLGHLKQDGIVVGSGLERLSSKLSVQANATDYVKLGMDLNYSNTTQKTALADGAYFSSPILGGYLYAPTMAPYTLKGTPNFKNPSTGGTNFIGALYYDSENSKTDRLIGNINTDIRLNKTISFNSKFGIDRSNYNFTLYGSPKNFGNPVGGTAQRLNSTLNTWNWTNTLKWVKTANKHHFDFLIGQEANYESLASIDFEARDFPSLMVKNIGSAINTVNHASQNENASLLSFFGNLGYNFNNKYHLNTTIRRDASSRFGQNNKWGTFWSVGANWLISDEQFMASAKWLNSLKLKSSYGVQGNTTSERYPWQRLLDSGEYDGNPTLYPFRRKGNPNLKWEVQKMFDLGIELTTIKKRFRLELNYFDRQTSDLIFESPLPPSSTYSKQITNAGNFLNKGIEIDLSYDIFKKDRFYWNIFTNFTLFDNEIIALEKGVEGIDGYYIRRVGEDWNTFYLREWAGVDPATGDPLWYDSNGNKTNNYNKAKQKIVGSANPDFYGGFGTSLEFKNWELTSAFSYQYGNKIFNTTAGLTNSDGVYYGINQSKDQLDRWQKPGDIAKNPKRVYKNTSQSNQPSTRFLEDGSFIRLKNVMLSYSLPKKTSKSMKLNTCRIYTQATNLLTWTAFNGDPEQSIDGQHWFVYPNAKSLTIGVDVAF